MRVNFSLEASRFPSSTRPEVKVFICMYQDRKVSLLAYVTLPLVAGWIKSVNHDQRGGHYCCCG